MKRSLVAALVAVVLAVVGCVLVLFYVSGAESRALTGKEPVEVVIAAKKIPAGTTGTRVKSGAFTKVVVMPKSTVPADAMSELGPHLDELVVTSDVQPGQLVLGSAFGELSKTNSLALPEGKLAVSFPVKCVGSLRVGDKIAIFDTFNSLDGVNHIPDGKLLSFADKALHVTRLVLPKAEVIAVISAKAADTGGKSNSNADTSGNGNASSQPADGERAAASAACGGASDAMVTVAVTQDEAEKIIHRVQTGTLSFAVVDDKSDVKPGPGVDTKQVF